MATKFDLVVSQRFLQGFAANGGQGVKLESSGRVFRSKADAKRSRLMLAGARDRRLNPISDALPFGRMWYAGRGAISNAIGYGRSPDAVIRIYDVVGNVIETHEHAGQFREW
jgi:hypothetical protein